MAKSTVLICPFTLKPLSQTVRDDVAVIYQGNPFPSVSASSDGAAENPVPAAQEYQCGHSCTLSRLVPYLLDVGGSKSCPVCQTSPATVICDSFASSFFMRQCRPDESNEDGESDPCEGRIVSFRYGTAIYFLWVHSSPPSSYYSKLFNSRKENALDRIGSVLGMDVKNGLKVIHKGKVIYPANAKKKESSCDISEQLLDISSTDLIHHRRKPSLVVMGLREKTTAVRYSNIPNARSTIRKIANILTPWYIWSLMACGIEWTLRTSTYLVGGVWLFIRSILYPPQTNQ